MEAVRSTNRQQVTDSLLERSLGRFGGWQMTPGQPARDIEVRSATGKVMSRARGAALGAVEADVLTWLLAQWVRAGCSSDGVIHTTLYQLTSALYGGRTVGSKDRRAVVDALVNLHMASVTLSDYDEVSGNDLSGRYVDVHLIKRIHYGEQLQALRDHQEVSAQELGALRGETLAIYVDDWLISRLQTDTLRTWLDWPIQRQMGVGIGKRMWLFLEPHPGFRSPSKRPDVEVLRLVMTDAVYAELGANCREHKDNRKTIRRGMERILEVDDRYQRFELKTGRGAAPDELLVLRRRRAASAGPPADAGLDLALLAD